MTIIGLDIGGTKCAVIKGDAGGKYELVRRFPTTTPQATLDELFRTVEEAKPDGDAVFGVSCGSPQDSAAGVILEPPNLPGWKHVHITKMLTDRFGGRAHLMNDANAGALAEWIYGAAKGYRNVVFLTAGTGMGAGLILDGRLYEGTNYYAGEVGHIRLAPSGPVGYGKAGSFEGFCSGGGIAQLAQAKASELGGKVAFNPGRIEDITTKDVALAAAAGDATAREILRFAGDKWGSALAIIMDVLNPEVIVLGSLYVRCREFFEPAIAAAVAREALTYTASVCKIVPASLGEEIGNYATLAVAVYREGVH